MGFTKHETAIVDGDAPQIGDATTIWNHSHIREGARIGAGCNIGQNVYIGKDCVVGDGCKIQNNVNVYEGVSLADDVFCGPSMTFTNLSRPVPRAAISRRDLLQKTVVHRGASFGANSVVVCGHVVGAYAFVAAGAVVVRDVGAYQLVAGNPARVIGHVCECGGRLHFDKGAAQCELIHQDGTACALAFRIEDGEVVRVVATGQAEK